MPEIEELAEKYGDKVKFCKLDISKARRLAIKQKVMGVPAFNIYKDGEKQKTIAGDDLKAEDVEEALKAFI